MKTSLLLTLLIISNSSYAVSVKIAENFLKSWIPALYLENQELDSTVDSLLSFYTDDAVLIDPNFEVEQKGKAAIRSYYSIVMSKYPFWKFKTEEIFSTKSGFVLHYTGTVPGVISQFRGVDIINLVKVDGEYKISKLIGIYDRVPFLPRDIRE